MTSHVRTSPRVQPCVIRSDVALRAAYIPQFIEGGLFVPCRETYALGDDVHVLLTLPDSTERHALVGIVGWVNPARVGGGREQGVGVRFPDSEEGAQLRARIERILGSTLTLRGSSQTI